MHGQKNIKLPFLCVLYTFTYPYREAVHAIPPGDVMILHVSAM